MCNLFNQDGSTKDFLSLHKITNTLLNFSQSNKSLVSVTFFTSFIILCIGISKLEVENRFIDYFDKNTEIYKGMLEIDSKLGGTATLDIIISQPEDTFESIEIDDEFFDDDLFDDETSTAAGYWWNIYSLKELEDIHDYLDSIPEIGRC